MATVPRYDPTWPAIAQNDDWSCGPTSTRWCLWAYGRQPSEAWIESTMIAEGVVSTDLGVLDASGAGLAAFLNRHYGEDGYVAQNDASVDFDDLAAEAATGKHPLAFGGRAWNHWSGLRGYDAVADVLRLANPAPGWPSGTGPQQTMNRQQFDALGPFSMVRLTHPAAEAQPPTAILSGVDVASHQGAVDWATVAGAGQAFAFTKATGGTWYRNPTFARNWLGIKSAGLVRGAYHYAFESSGDPLPGDGPEAEADYFVAELNRGGGVAAGDLLALDLEEGQGNLANWALRWLRRVRGRVGFKPLFYSRTSFVKEHGLDVPELAEYALWLAAYQATMPPVPSPWTSITIWQHSQSGRVPGIVGDVDLNQFRGSREQLVALGKGGAPASPFVVGPGILSAMQARGDSPASDELAFKHGERDEWAEALGTSGTRYVWIVSLGRVFYFPPAP